MARAPVTVSLSGFREYHRALKSISQPELEPLLKKALKESSQKHVAPTIKRGAPVGPSPHKSAGRGTRGKKGPLKRSIRPKQIKRKSLRKHRALVGYTTQPRAWYGHFVSGGTRRHSLAKGAKLRTNTNQNRPPIHPGSRPNDFIARGLNASESQALTYIHRIVLLRYKQRVKA